MPSRNLFPGEKVYIWVLLTIISVPSNAQQPTALSRPFLPHTKEQELTMILLQTVTLFAALSMASPPPNRRGDDLASVAEPRAVATRDIMMWTNHTQTDETVKFVDVPVNYRYDDIKHADLVGMFWVFNTGEAWLTLKGKRLFRLPAGDGGSAPPGPEAPEDFPIMSPEELERVLASGEFPPYNEVHAKWKAMEARILAKRDTDGTKVARGANSPDSRNGCIGMYCDGSWNCWPESNVAGECYRCNRGRCLWDGKTPNSMTPNPGVGVGSGGHREIKRDRGAST